MSHIQVEHMGQYWIFLEDARPPMPTRAPSPGKKWNWTGRVWDEVNASVGKYNPEKQDDPNANILHPKSLTNEQADRYGECHEKALEWAKANDAEVFTNGDHSIAVTRDEKVFDYVLGFNGNISLGEYLRQVPMEFHHVPRDEFEKELKKGSSEGVSTVSFKRGYKVDTRFSPTMQKKREEDEDTVDGYINGKYKPLAKVSNSNYSVVILENGRELYFKKGNQEPVPAGKWMDWYEPDHKVSEDEYNKLPREKRAELEAKLQLDKWVEKQYKELFVDFYFPDEFEKFWWDGSGAELRMRQETHPQFFKKIDELYQKFKGNRK